MKVSWLLAMVVLAGSSALAEEIKLPITADVGICAHKDEQKINTGGRAQVRVKGIEHYYLLDFDAAKLREPVTKATLHLKLAGGKLRQVAFATVPIGWIESTAKGEPQNGSSCYTHVSFPDKAWTETGGTFLDATFNNPYMTWQASAVEYDGAWMKIPIAPRLVEAVRLGLSHGLAMSDEKGQTRENHDVFTREQSDAAPYLVVETSPPPKVQLPAATFKAEPCPDAADLAKGALMVTLDAEDPADRPPSWLGWRIRLSSDNAEGKEVLFREAVTLAGRQVIFRDLEPGRTFIVQADAFANVTGQKVSPPAQRVAASAALKTPRPPITLDPKTLDGSGDGWKLKLYPASAVLRPMEKDNPASGLTAPTTARNAWVGLQALIVPPGGQADNVTLEVDPFVEFGKNASAEQPPAALPVRVFRQWFVPSDKAWHAEALVPLKLEHKDLRPDRTEAMSIPWQQNKLPAQDCQAVFVDVWVPAATGPGTYSSKLRVLSGEKEVATAPLLVHVAAVDLPDTFDIIGDMNTYDSPARAMGVKADDDTEFFEAERKYYRLAQSHRMTLNVLPYSQAGEVHRDSAPAVAADGTISDWTKWNQRYGPLLDGSAFGPKTGYVGPGADTPIHHMYLPVHENWPARLADHFKPWPPPTDYGRFLLWSAELPPIEACLNGAYPKAISTTMREFTRNVKNVGRGTTRLQFYLNDKEQFRDKKNGSGRGVSLWTLDEPMYSDDFLALAYFGKIAAWQQPQIIWKTGNPAAFRGARPRVQILDFRVDISRPTHQRNWLDGLVHLNVVSDLLYSQRWWIDYRKRNFGEEYWDYHMPPSFSGDNLGWSAWPVKGLCWGATGTLPWQTIASDGEYDRASATALMYPPQRFGLDEPLPSLRMKAWRQGLQDAQLLWMLRQKMKWNDIQLRAFVGQACGLDGWRDGFSPRPDAPIVSFAGLSPAAIETLRRAAIAAIGPTAK